MQLRQYSFLISCELLSSSLPGSAAGCLQSHELSPATVNLDQLRRFTRRLGHYTQCHNATRPPFNLCSLRHAASYAAAPRARRLKRATASGCFKSGAAPS